VKQLEMKLTLENEELDLFTEIALQIQQHLKTLANQQSDEDEEDE
jgi:hypothetical protein